MSKAVAKAFGGVWIPEYARFHIEGKGNMDMSKKDILEIANIQRALKESLGDGSKLVVADTESITTKIWSEALLGYVVDGVEEVIARGNFDLYILTNIDTDWVGDDVRYFPEKEQREWFQEKFISLLEKYNKNFKIIGSGSYEDKEREVFSIVEEFVGGS